jgi:hypothetical protein
MPMLCGPPRSVNVRRPRMGTGTPARQPCLRRLTFNWAREWARAA